jgi:superfamily II DNA or RNA helicase
MTDERRHFSWQQKFAVSLLSGVTGEGDHIQPVSKGGRTTVENCQVLDATVNKQKGSFCFEPRTWQRNFLRDWNDRTPNVPFMLIAIPGSGKTMAALEAARRWMAAGSDRRVVVVVPSDNLRNQWQQEARRFGIELQTKEFGTNFKHGFQGAVVTYHLVGNQPLLFRKLCSVAPTMAIFDEIHHCGDESHFGMGIKEGFCLAKEILCMSGTPWKTDGVPIPFVRYDGNGYAVADCRYDYPDAWIDEVVRYLVFDYAKGAITNDATGQRLELTQDVSEEEAAARLRILLEPNGEYVRQQIADAHRKLIECRKTVTDAAAMAICVDQFHATKVARVITQETGCDPSIIVSDEQLENDTVEAFRRSRKEWLVSVRKVSEGTDIKRLQVLCYLTNVTSELFFRQVIGRVARVRGLDDYEGYVYLPADPRLIRCAQNIENAQVIAVREHAEREWRERERQDHFTTWTTEHAGTDLVLIGTVMVPVAEAREIERIAETVGISMQKAMEVRSMVLAGVSTAAAPPPEAPPRSMSLEEEIDVMRRKCHKAAFQLAQILKIDVKDVNKRFKPHKKMSLAELKAKHLALLVEIRQC